MKSDSKKVWIAWGNTDLTEGKGAAYPKHICELEATAIRLGKKGYVQGSDCPVREDTAYRIGGLWYGPCRIVHPSVDDENVQAKADEIGNALDEAEKAVSRPGTSPFCVTRWLRFPR